MLLFAFIVAGVFAIADPGSSDDEDVRRRCGNRPPSDARRPATISEEPPKAAPFQRLRELPVVGRAADWGMGPRAVVAHDAQGRRAASPA